VSPAEGTGSTGSVISRHSKGFSYAVAVLVTILWSSSYVFIKLGLEEVPPLYFAAVRYTLAFAILATIDLSAHGSGKKSNEGHTPRASPLVLLVAGIAGYTIAQGFQYVGLFFLPAVTTSFLLNFTPVFVLLIGYVAFSEKPSRLQVYGLVAAIVGAYLFFSDRISWQGEWLGVVVVLASGLGWAAYVVIVRQLQVTRVLSSLRLTTTTMGAGVAGMLVLSAATEGFVPLAFNLVLAVVWLATINTALAFFLWNWVLKTLPSYELTMVQSLMLVEIAIFALVFLQETITASMAVGMALVFAGVLTVQLRSRQTGGSPH